MPPPRHQHAVLSLYYSSIIKLHSAQVTLVEPVIAKQKQGAPAPNPKLNSQNNVEWRLELSPGESRSVTIYYTVEFPVNKEVEGL